MRTYPWGEGLDSTRANYGHILFSPKAVGSYPLGVSPFGVYDMAGNLWEWVDDWYDAYPDNTDWNLLYGTNYKVLRGGSWNSSDYYSRSSSRYRDNPTIINNDHGFRCARGAN